MSDEVVLVCGREEFPIPEAIANRELALFREAVGCRRYEVTSCRDAGPVDRFVQVVLGQT